MASTPLSLDQVGVAHGLLLGPVADPRELFAVGHVDRDEVTRRFAQAAAKFETPRADGYPADHVDPVYHLWALLDRHRQACDEPRVVDDQTIFDDDMDCVEEYGWCGDSEYWVWPVPAGTPGAIALTRARRHETNLTGHHHTAARCGLCGDPLPRTTATGNPLFPDA